MYQEWLAKPGIATSIGSRGDSYGHALAETINGLLKAGVGLSPWALAGL